MLPSERRRRLLAHLNEEGAVAVPELSAALSVSQATVRRDLATLASAGRLTRVRGGAVTAAPGVDLAEPLYDDKLRRYQQEKAAIAREAATRVQNGDVLAIDSGSTAWALANELLRFEDLTVITTDLKIALALTDEPTFDVIVVGGSVRTGLYSVVGPLAEQALRTLGAGMAFIGADAVDVTKGVTNASLAEVAVKRALLRCAHVGVLLADHSKFDHVSLAEVAPLSGFSEVITDARIDEGTASRYRAAGASLTLARLED